MPRPAEQDVPSSLIRGLRLLELFTPQQTEMSISELARRSKTPKSTAHRLVLDLLEWGALERGHHGVRLGVRMFELGHLVPDHSRLRDLAIPFAHSLNEITRLTANLAVREGSEIIYLEKISRRDLSVPHSRVGGRLPLHCTALGKAILAFDDPAFVGSVLAGPLHRRSPKTITEPEILRRQLADVRRAGIAFDLEESQLGLFCVGAPIFAQGSRVAGAISVTGATSQSQAQKFSSVVHATAQALTYALAPRRKHH